MHTITNVLKKTLKPTQLPHLIQDIAICIPRILGGYLMAFNFGASKFGMPWSPADKDLQLFEVIDWFITDVEGYGGLLALAPSFFAWMGAASEAIGGLFLMAGLGTRFFSFLLFITMMVAIFCQQLPNGGLWNSLAPAGFAWIFLYGMTLGSGRIGLDHFIAKKYNF